MRSLKLCRVSPPGKSGSRKRKDGAGVSALHNASYPHLIHRLGTTPTEHLFDCMVHLTEHLFDFITQPTEHTYGLRIRVGGYDKIMCMANTKTASRGCQNVPYEVAKYPSRGCQKYPYDIRKYPSRHS
jgi:hypothetical protein